MFFLYIDVVVRRWMTPTKSWNFWHHFFWFFSLFEVRFLYHFIPSLFAMLGNLTLFPFTLPQGWGVEKRQKEVTPVLFFSSETNCVCPVTRQKTNMTGWKIKFWIENTSSKEPFSAKKIWCNAGIVSAWWNLWSFDITNLMLFCLFIPHLQNNT